jgi:hypothetical protein
MAEEISPRADVAVRSFIGAVGFVFVLIGGEMMAEREGTRFWWGAGLVALSFLFYLSAVIWQQIKERMNRHLVKRLGEAATDIRWWIGTVLAILVILSVAPFINVQWNILAPILVGGGMAAVAIAVSGGPIFHRSGSITIVTNDPSQNVMLDLAPLREKIGQADRDLLILLDFAVYQATLAMLDGLIRIAPRLAESDADLTEEKFDALQEFLGAVRRTLAGTHRMIELRSLLDNAESQAEHDILQTRPDQRPADIDPLIFRRRRIAHVQSLRTLAYLHHEKGDVEGKIQHRRSGLIERLNLRSPP